MTPTNRPRRVRAASLAIAVALAVAACSGDDDAADERTAATAAEPAATSPAGDTAAEEAGEADDADDVDAADDADDTGDAGDADDADDGDTGLDDADEADYQDAAERALQVPDAALNECLSAAYVDWLDVDRLRAAGITPDALAGSLSAADLGITTDAAGVEPLSEAIDDCGDVVQRLFDDADLTDVQRECTERFLTEELGAQLLAHQLAGLPQSDELSAVQDDVQACAADE